MGGEQEIRMPIRRYYTQYRFIFNEGNKAPEYSLVLEREVIDTFLRSAGYGSSRAHAQILDAAESADRLSTTLKISSPIVFPSLPARSPPTFKSRHRNTTIAMPTSGFRASS